MGLFGRSKNRDAESDWWSYAGDVVRPDEQRITYAHLTGWDAQGGLDGTLFLTDRQVVWRITAPGPARGDGFQSPLAEVLGMGQDADKTPGVFALGVTIHGERGMVQFSPQRPGDPASVQLAEELREAIEREWKRAKGGAG